MSKSFIPEFFEAPQFAETEFFYFRVLEDEIAELDFEAVMSSQKKLKGIFGSDSQWPNENMTLAENIASLKVHKQEFASREAFAYSIFNKAKNKCLGSIYIDPSASRNYQCEVYFWLRDDSTELEHTLYQTILKWLADDWPFSKIAFPGRCISWEEWKAELKTV